MEILAVDGSLRAPARELVRRTAVRPGANLFVERLGDDAYAHLGGEATELAAIDGGEVVGFVFGHVRDRHVWEGGAWCAEPLLYLTDLRVRPDQRRKRVAVRLLDAIAERAVEAGARRGFCLVDEGNEAMLRMLEGERSRLGGRVEGVVTTWERMVPPGGGAPVDGWAVVGPEAVDLSAVPRRPPGWLAPVWTAGEVSGLARLHPELRFAVHRDAPGEPRFGLWDQRRLRRCRGALPDGVAGWILGAWRAWAWVQGGLAPPRANEASLGLEVVLDGGEDLTTRLDVGAAWAQPAGCQVVHAVGEGPPEGGIAYPRRAALVTLGIDGAVPPSLNGQKPGIDPGFV